VTAGLNALSDDDVNTCAARSNSSLHGANLMDDGEPRSVSWCDEF
jgi:hypothetical protein